MSSDDEQFDRRSVLKTIGATAVVGAGLGAASGTVTALKTKQQLTRSYSDEGRLRTAFQRHGDDLRATLVDEGFVGENFDFGSVEFELDAEVTGLEPKADDRLAGVTAIREEGTFTAFGMASTSSDTHEVALFVQPERETAYALVEPKDADDRFIVTDAGVSPTGTCDDTDCGTCCTENYRTWKNYECDAYCNCSVVETDCGSNCFDCDCGDLTTC